MRFVHHGDAAPGERRPIDAAALTADRRALLDAVGAALRFPAYAASNWDAFEECLRDAADFNPAGRVALELRGAEALDRATLDTLVAIWQAAAPAVAGDGLELHLVLS